MAERNEPLPRPVDELEELAAHYDTGDTSAEMEHGEWVDPRPMRTTSLRLPGEVVDALKALAATRGIRYTALVREIIENAVNGVPLVEFREFARINERLARIEAAVVEQADEPVPPRPTGRSTRTRVPVALHGRTRKPRSAKAVLGSRRRVAGKG
ncbi:hypothetical protein ACIGNX_09150 [Actinosynnema sp. NPDC053489]|uniref:hypothetical protein n=1 Tax=Actinosynnema sp. NPDC053489 TaxID=3363916 RepID=UPI0037C8C322